MNTVVAVAAPAQLLLIFIRPLLLCMMHNFQSHHRDGRAHLTPLSPSSDQQLFPCLFLFIDKRVLLHGLGCTTQPECTAQKWQVAQHSLGSPVCIL